MNTDIPLRSLLVVAALVFGASGCSSTDGSSTSDELSATSISTGDASSGSETSEGSESDGSASTVDGEADGAAEDPADTVGESEEPGPDDGQDGAPTGDLAGRLAGYLLANPDGLEIDQAQADCTGQTMAEVFPADRLELLVTNLEQFDEIEDGRQFSDDERLVIAEGFAACLDFAPLVDQVAAEAPALTPVVDCVEADSGIDRVEAAMLAGALGEDTAGPENTLLIEGLTVCAETARSALAGLLSERTGATEGIDACLAAYDDEALLAALRDDGIFGLFDELERTCLGG